MSGGFSGQRGGFTHWQFLPLSGGTVVGAVTFSAAVTLSSTLAVTGAMTLASTLVQTKDAIGTGATAGYTLRNTTDAAAGAQQYSPMFVLTGEGWKTDVNATTQVWDWAQQNRPVEGAAASTSALHFLSQVDGGGYTSRMNLSSGGVLELLASGQLVFVDGGQGLTGLTSPGAGQMQFVCSGGTLIRGNASALGFFGTTPTTKPSAYTQTYSTADKTHANNTATDLATTAATQTTSWGFAGAAQADNIATQFNALRVDVTDLKQLVNSIIDDLQLLGLVS